MKVADHPASRAGFRVTLEPRALLVTLASAIVSIGLVSGIATAIHLTYLGPISQIGMSPFMVSRESSLPTWYSSVTLLLAAALLAVIAAAAWRTRDRYRLHWAGLSALFVVMSIDEVATIHEHAGELLEAKSEFAAESGGYLTYSWVLIAIPLVALLALVYLRFARDLPRRTRLLFVASALIFLGGSVGIEMVNANTHDTIGRHTLRWHMWTLAEELCEMAGVALFLYALADHLRRMGLRLSIRLGGA